MLIDEQTFRVRLKNMFYEMKDSILSEESGESDRDQKYWELQRWVDGFEAAALIGGMDTRIADIIEEVTGDTLAAWRSDE